MLEQSLSFSKIVPVAEYWCLEASLRCHPFVQRELQHCARAYLDCHYADLAITLGEVAIANRK